MMFSTRIWIVVACLCLPALEGRGQVEIELHVENSSYLTYEPLVAKVTIHNVGILPLHVNGAGPNSVRLSFEVERNNGDRAQPLPKVPPVPKLVVEPGHEKTLPLDLVEYFSMGRNARYFVRARLDGVGVEVRSRLEMVDVVSGLELAHTLASVPGVSGVARTYSLRYWSRQRAEHLFLCVSEAPSDRVFTPVYLGVLVRVIRPTVSVDAAGTVTVSHQLNRSQMMVSSLRSTIKGISLRSQRPVRIQNLPNPQSPTLPRK